MDNSYPFTRMFPPVGPWSEGTMAPPMPGPAPVAIPAPAAPGGLSTLQNMVLFPLLAPLIAGNVGAQLAGFGAQGGSPTGGQTGDPQNGPQSAGNGSYSAVNGAGTTPPAGGQTPASGAASGPSVDPALAASIRAALGPAPNGAMLPGLGPDAARAQEPPMLPPPQPQVVVPGTQAQPPLGGPMNIVPEGYDAAIAQTQGGDIGSILAGLRPPQVAEQPTPRAPSAPSGPNRIDGGMGDLFAKMLASQGGGGAVTLPMLAKLLGR